MRKSLHVQGVLAAVVFAVAWVCRAESDNWYLATFSVVGSAETTGRTVTLDLPESLYVMSADLASVRTNALACVYRPWRSVEKERILKPKFGTWQVKGPHAFSDLLVREVRPRYAMMDGISLGTGEAFMAGRYRFASDYKSMSPAFADRAFHSAARGYFHQPFWRFQKDGELVYRHEIGDRALTEATVRVTTCYGNAAAWGIEVSKDGKAWRSIFEKEKPGEEKVDVPADFLPCKELYVRIIGRGTGDFRVESYQLSAAVGNAPVHVVGQTDWIDIKTGKAIPMPGDPVPVPVVGACVPGDDPSGLRLWTCDAGWKVMPDSPVPTARTKGVAVRLAANETEAVQLVLRSGRNRSTPKVTVGDLVSSDGARIPAACVEVLRAGYVKVDNRTDKTCPRGLRWPDPLFAAGTKEPPLVADENRICWIRVKAPKGSAKGVYRGAITVGEAKVPLAVEVFGFELPDTMTCQTSFGFRHHQIIGMQRLHGDTLGKVLPKYVKCLADHHIATDNSDPTTRLKCTWTDGEPSFNWSEWDAKIERDVNVYHYNSISIPTLGTLGSGTYQARRLGKINGVTDGEPGYEELVGKFWRAVDRHLVEKGWADKSFVYWFDEPDKKDYLFVSNGFARLKKYAPHVKRFLTEQPEEALMDGVNLWCPVTPTFHDHPELTKVARARGDTFWWYVCCAPKGPYATEFIDKPGVEMRVWLWQTWKENVTGILIWDTIYWTSGTVYDYRKGIRQNPYLDTQSWADNGAYGWGNGDGRFLYPPTACFEADGRWSAEGPEILDGPVESYRLEMLRDGIEDYEYFAILKRLDPKNPLLAVPADVTSSLTEFSKAPAPMARHRLKLAREIERLKFVREQ